MGLTIDYFYSLTPRQFHNVQVGWNQNQEMQIKTSWEQTRRLYEGILRPYIKDKNKTVQDLLPMPWDVEDVQQMGETEGFEAMQERWRLIDERKKMSVRIDEVGEEDGKFSADKHNI